MALLFIDAGQVSLKIALQWDGRNVVGAILVENPATFFSLGLQSRERGRTFGEIVQVEQAPIQPGRLGDEVQQASQEKGQIRRADNDIQVI